MKTLILLTCLLILTLAQPAPITADSATIDLPTKGDVEEVAYSPDGKFIAVNSAGGLHLYDAVDLEQEPYVMLTDASIQTFQFNPDGRYLAAGDMMNSLIYVWDLTDPLAPPILTIPDAAPKSFSISSQRLAYYDSELKILDLTTGQTMLSGAFPAPAELKFSPDETMLVYQDEIGVVYLLDALTLEQRFVSGGKSYPHSITFTSDSRFLVYSGGEYGGVEMWDTQTGDLHMVLESSGDNLNIQASSNNRFIGYETSPSITVRDIERHQLHTELSKNDAVIFDYQFSPDGNYIVTMDSEGGLYLWDLVTQNSPKRLNSDHTDSITHRLSFHPDGTKLVIATGDDIVLILDITGGQGE